MESVQILRAIRFAADKHRNQCRKDSRRSPYIVHPIAAAEILIEAGIYDETTLIAVILHDTIEDTDCSVEEIVQAFGTEIAQITLELTVPETGVKEIDKAREISDAAHLSTKAALVRIADKLSNLADVIEDTPIGWTEERRDRYIFWVQEVIKAANCKNEQLHSRLNQLIKAAESKLKKPFLLQ